ncbi:MAG: MauE/DoxX family redox-associated membrane protein [Acidimicrobiales bacterium]
MRTLSWLMAAPVGAAFAWAGANKVTDMRSWHAAARAQALPRSVATVVPVIEVLLGSALVVTRPVPVTLGAATVLLLVFTAFLAVQVATGSTVPCACFGARAARPPSGRDVARNLLMISALVASAALR